jgi:hypothetical protein
MDKWRRNENVDRSKKESVEKWRKEKNNEDDLRSQDRLENRYFNRRDDCDRDHEREREREREREHDRDRDHDREMDTRRVSISFK